MPCRYETDDDIIREQSQEIRTLTAMLCMVLKAVDKRVGIRALLKTADEIDSGLTQDELWDWWLKHKRQDEARKRREESEKKDSMERIAALQKLTPRERDLLGLKQKVPMSDTTSN